MTLPSVKFGIVSAIVVASVATPLVIRYCAQVRVQEKQELLRPQAAHLAQLTVENERLSNLLAQAKPQRPLFERELMELLRLRSEVGQLRAQTNAIQKLREENRRLDARSTTAPDQRTPKSPAELDEELAAQTIEAMKNICRELQPAWRRFADDHHGQAPTCFSQLRDYFPTTGGRMPGLYISEFVRDQGPQPGDALILREATLHGKPDGEWARVYAFSDGRVVEVTPDGGDFDAWEKQHMILPASGGQ